VIRRLVNTLPRPRSIRAQLLGLVAVIAVPLVALQAYASYQNYRLTVRQAELEVLRLAETVGTGARQFVSLAESQMTGVAEVMGRTGLDPGACRELVFPLREALQFVTAITAVDATGGVVCSTLSTPPAGMPNVAEREWFQSTRESHSFVIGPPQVAVIEFSDWIAVLAAPVLDEDGQFLGAVASGIYLERFEELLAGVTIPESALVTITNADGRILARNIDPEHHVGGQTPPEFAPSRPVAPNLNLASGPDLSGIERTWSRLVLPEVGWRIYVGLPSDQVFGPARAALIRGVLSGVLFLGMALALAFLFYRRISTSLGQLTRGTEAAAGGRAVHLPADALREVREVGDQLNRTLEARSRAEAAERLSKEHFLSIFENATFGICLGTRDGRFLEVNPALVSMLGYDSAEELLAVDVTSLYATTEDREQLLEEHLRENTYEDIETEWRRKDGSMVTVRMNGRLLFSDQGLVFVTIVEDITGEKILEEQLRQTQKMEAIGRLAGGVAHDFNNLLTVIMGHARLLLDRPGPSEQQADAEQILAASERAAALTQQLLSFSRKQVVQPRPIDLNQVVGDLQKMLGRLIGEDIELVTELDRTLPAVMADPGEIEQVVINLAVNARDAMPDGGRLCLSTSSRAVEGRSEADAVGTSTGQYVVLTVTDNGVGMDPEVAKLAFDPFFTTKPVGKGTGLGLATVYGIVSIPSQGRAAPSRCFFRRPQAHRRQHLPSLTGGRATAVAGRCWSWRTRTMSGVFWPESSGARGTRCWTPRTPLLPSGSQRRSTGQSTFSSPTW